MERKKLSLDSIGRISKEEYKDSDKLPLVIIMDNIRSMNNVGSVFRSSDAFRIEKLYLCGITPKPPHREIHKTALGSTDNVDWESSDSAIETIRELQGQGYLIYSLEQTLNSINLKGFIPIPNKKYGIVIGNEVDGVSQEIIDICDGVIEIPQFGTKHSLNVSVATGIIIWDLYSKLGIELIGE